MSTADERWLSVEEIAEYLSVTKDSIYRWIERRSLPTGSENSGSSRGPKWMSGCGQVGQQRGVKAGARGPFSSPDPRPLG